MREQRSVLEEQIDLRGLIRSLLRYKWWILGITALAAIAGLVAGQLAQPQKTYQAKSLLVFGQPTLNMLNPSSGSQVNSAVNITALPDTKGVTDLAEMDDVIYEVYQAPELAQSRSHGLTFGKLKGELAASLSGTNQLLLQAKDPDAKQSVLLANLWAETVAERLNTLYGSSNAQVTALQGQTQAALEAWQAASKALVDYLPDSKADALAAQLTQEQLAYNALLGKSHSIDLILSDGRALDARLSGQATAALAGGDALSLLALQQRANEVLLCNPLPSTRVQSSSEETWPLPPVVASVESPVSCSPSAAASGLQLQLADATILSGQDTAGSAQQQLKSFMDSLQAQQTEVKASLASMDHQLADLHSQLEAANAEVDQLVVRRDLAKAAYESTSAELNNTRVEVVANGQVARVAGKAMQANRSSSGRILLYAIVAAALAFIICVPVIYLIEWMRAPGMVQR